MYQLEANLPQINAILFNFHETGSIARFKFPLIYLLDGRFSLGYECFVYTKAAGIMMKGNRAKPLGNLPTPSVWTHALAFTSTFSCNDAESSCFHIPFVSMMPELDISNIFFYLFNWCRTPHWRIFHSYGQYTRGKPMNIRSLLQDLPLYIIHKFAFYDIDTN